ncbi:hypothetical protein ACGFZC_16150 [[Kitasatospora] papulosa]|uniref:hypothetical protein n=1 Tax=[Kitasatospora] papulosa TaxID=1464011 RepID=UPI00371656E9
MAEISYPFNADNATTGAAKAVSESQWQKMSHMWGGDRVDHQLGNGNEPSANLPFSSKTINVTTLQISPGRAWVGGFFYELTSAQNVTITANAATTARIDLVVLRLDMAKPAVNLTVRQGVNAATPVEPQPVRQIGGVWELPLYAVTVPASGGALVVNLRVPFDRPPSVSFPWNASLSMGLMPAGSFGYDMDNNSSGSQQEYFRGRDALVITRSLGKATAFTPSIVLASSTPPAQLMTYTGQWRWIAPNTVSFSVYIHNATTNISSTNNVALGIRLPVPAHESMRQVFSGVLNNSAGQGGYPTFTSLTGFTGAGASSSYFTLYLPSPTNPAGGLDNFRTFPSRSSIYVSGTYEANTF